MLDAKAVSRMRRGSLAVRIGSGESSRTGPAGARDWAFRPSTSPRSTSLIPADGVYAARAWIDGRGPAWPAACNIGPNPTFGEQARKVEAHLIGFSGDLYGRSVDLEFVQRLRGTRRFDGLDELLEQVRLDVEATRRVCTSSLPVPTVDPG